MKGLLLKDFYMVGKCCRMYIFIIAAFIVITLTDGSTNPMMFIYPCFFTSVFPVTLLSVDERDRWDFYSGIFPYTRKQIVASKYILGIIIQGIVFAVVAVIQLILGNAAGTFDPENYALTLGLLAAAGTIGPAVMLPFIFRFGPEKGRTVYFAVVFAVCIAATTLSYSPLTGLGEVSVSAYAVAAVMAIVSVVMYVISWVVAARLYETREI